MSLLQKAPVPAILHLRNASFYQVALKNTDFEGAILINTYLNEAKNLSLARINKKDLNR